MDGAKWNSRRNRTYIHKEASMYLIKHRAERKKKEIPFRTYYHFCKLKIHKSNSAKVKRNDQRCPLPLTEKEIEILSLAELGTKGKKKKERRKTFGENIITESLHFKLGHNPK